MKATLYRCKFCEQPIGFKDCVPLNEDGSQHRCLANKGIPCNACGEPINFQNRSPVNLDGSAHRCIAEYRQREKMSVNPVTGELFDPRGQA